jgi:hypothetical protein
MSFSIPPPISCRELLRAREHTSPGALAGDNQREEKDQIRSGAAGGEQPWNSREATVLRNVLTFTCELLRFKRWPSVRRNLIATNATTANSPAAIASVATWNSVSLVNPGLSQKSKASNSGAIIAAIRSTKRTRRKGQGAGKWRVASGK